MPSPPSSTAVAGAAAAALLALVLLFRGLSRAWADQLPWGLRPLVVPALAVVATVAFLAMDPAAASMEADGAAAMRANPFLAFDSAHGARTFHLLAWPLGAIAGDRLAVAMLAGLSVGAAVLLVHALARSLGAPPWAALLAQALLASAPELRAPVLAGHLASLLGVAGEVAVLAHLARRLTVLEAARDGAAACAFLAGAQALYAGSIPMTLALVLAVAAFELVTGHRRRARWLVGAWGFAFGIVALLQYAWSIAALQRMDLAEPHGAGRVGLGMDAAIRAALALGVVGAALPSPAAARAQVAALAAAAIVVLLGARLPPLPEHALAFASAPLCALAAAGAARMLSYRAGGERQGRS